MNRNCLIWKQKARTRLQQKIFSMLLFNFVLHCTFNMTVPVHCLLCITSEQNCQQVQLSQKKSKGRVWTEGCHNFGFELVSKLIRVQHQSRYIGLPTKTCSSHRHTMGISKPHSFIPLNVSKFQPTQTIRLAGGRFTPIRNGQPHHLQ